ncbi:MAG: malto-oligosyltrehalose trehalohydrolase [bacterium]
MEQVGLKARMALPVMAKKRKFPLGAEVFPEGGVHFRVWAPLCRKVEVVFEDSQGEIELIREPHGYFSGLVETTGEGMLYRYRLDKKSKLLPDPVSRFQPEGPHGPSEIINPCRYAWTDEDWTGICAKGQVIYEMHIGTFTRQGTWASAAKELTELAALGITVLEVMPVAEFGGQFGWGYDGVDLFAPSHLYGRPNDFRRFIDRAHALGMGVILDVVYNHFGPDGCYLNLFSEDYFSDRYQNEWGRAINFDDRHSGPVREFFLTNAGYWIDEFHLDGLRLDATQQMFDSSREHILAAITRTVREAATGRATLLVADKHKTTGRSTLLVAENEPQQAMLVYPLEKGGYGFDALWNDDFHRSATVAMTGKNQAYYSDYLGRPQELISAMKWGYLYQGQRYSWQKKRRGTPALGLPPEAFITYLQNHDQIANTGIGQRIHELTSPGRHRAMVALLLCGPGTPMLFQGQEFASSSPFFYFADHSGKLAGIVREGRASFLSQFPNLATPEIQASLPDPADPSTFERSKLNFADRQKHEPIYTMYKDLLKLRHEDPVLRNVRPRGCDGAVLDTEAFLLRFFADDGNDRLLLVNLGRDLHLDPAPEPLLAPPEGKAWKVIWSSEDVRYGGCGQPPVETEDNWRIPGQAAVLLIGEA